MQVPQAAPAHARVPCAQAQAFVFRDGVRAHSLDELAAALGAATPDVVAYHRDHFAPWLASVVGDVQLARRFEYYARAALEPELLRDTLRDLVVARLRQIEPLLSAGEQRERHDR